MTEVMLLFNVQRPFDAVYLLYVESVLLLVNMNAMFLPRAVPFIELVVVDDFPLKSSVYAVILKLRVLDEGRLPATLFTRI